MQKSLSYLTDEVLSVAAPHVTERFDADRNLRERLQHTRRRRDDKRHPAVVSKHRLGVVCFDLGRSKALWVSQVGRSTQKTTPE